MEDDTQAILLTVPVVPGRYTDISRHILGITPEGHRPYAMRLHKQPRGLLSSTYGTVEFIGPNNEHLEVIADESGQKHYFVDTCNDVLLSNNVVGGLSELTHHTHNWHKLPSLEAEDPFLPFGGYKEATSYNLIKQRHDKKMYYRVDETPVVVGGKKTVSFISFIMHKLGDKQRKDLGLTSIVEVDKKANESKTVHLIPADKKEIFTNYISKCIEEYKQTAEKKSCHVNIANTDHVGGKNTHLTLHIAMKPKEDKAKAEAKSNNDYSSESDSDDYTVDSQSVVTHDGTESEASSTTLQDYESEFSSRD